MVDVHRFAPPSVSSVRAGLVRVGDLEDVADVSLSPTSDESQTLGKQFGMRQVVAIACLMAATGVKPSMPAMIAMSGSEPHTDSYLGGTVKSATILELFRAQDRHDVEPCDPARGGPDTGRRNQSDEQDRESGSNKIDGFRSGNHALEKASAEHGSASPGSPRATVSRPCRRMIPRSWTGVVPRAIRTPISCVL